jgi:H/ACA ribonucleoprotein complex subunit 2
MGKDATEKREKKDRKEKKEKRASLDGVTKVKKEKKDKKSRKSDVADALEAELAKGEDSTMMDVTMVTDGGEEVAELTGALVPFAFPLAEDPKEVKKILKTVKKCELDLFQLSRIPGFCH